MEKIVKAGEVSYTIKELTIDEGLSMSRDLDDKTRTFEFVTKCIEPKLTVEEFKQLPFKTGLALINAVNEVNGLSDFQPPMTVN